MRPLRYALVVSALSSAMLAGCGSATLRQVSSVTNEARSCVSNVANRPQYAGIRSHTNIENPQNITAEMTLDPSYITPEDAVAMKSLMDEYFPCKKKAFEVMTTTAPDLQIPLIKVEIASRKNVNQLVNRKITWGQFNKNTIGYNSVVLKEAAPALQRIQKQINLEERQAAIQRQQAIALLAVLADTAITLNAIAEANRPVHTSCVRGVAGNYSCITR